MLNREQLDIFYRIEDVLVQIGKLKKEGNKILWIKEKKNIGAKINSI